MTVATFETGQGPVDVQAFECFRRLSDFLDGLGQQLAAARSLTIEVTDRRNLPLVAEAREQIFGSAKPRIVSSRFTRLPAGELVRVTVNTESSEAT